MSTAPTKSTQLSRGEWLVVGLGVAAFAPALLELAGVWRSTDYLTHCFLVPVVAGFVAVSRRPAWRTAAFERDLRGLVLIALALGTTVTGLLVDAPSLTGLGVVIAVTGGLFTLRGFAAVRVMAFPLAFLLFMVPPPPVWIDPLILRLQLHVSVAAVEILRLAGFAILRDGNVMVLPGGESLFVDEACSGITSVVTLVPLGVLLAWSTEHTALRRLVLVAFIVPAAMIGNLVRVTVTVWVAGTYSVEIATSGLLHEWAGLATYVLACGLLLGVGALQRRLFPVEATAGSAAG